MELNLKDGDGNKVLYQDIDLNKNVYMKDGRICTFEEESEQVKRKRKDKLALSKTLKDLNKGSLLASRFLNTVSIASKNIL